VNHLYALLALDIARERTREAERQWRHAAAIMDREASQTLPLRRRLAQFLAAVSRGSASIARRLDSRTADDLGRALAPAE
jgi:hypothetical protein